MQRSSYSLNSDSLRSSRGCDRKEATEACIYSQRPTQIHGLHLLNPRSGVAVMISDLRRGGWVYEASRLRLCTLFTSTFLTSNIHFEKHSTQEKCRCFAHPSNAYTMVECALLWIFAWSKSLPEDDMWSPISGPPLFRTFPSESLEYSIRNADVLEVMSSLCRRRCYIYSDVSKGDGCLLFLQKVGD